MKTQISLIDFQADILVKEWYFHHEPSLVSGFVLHKSVFNGQEEKRII